MKDTYTITCLHKLTTVTVSLRLTVLKDAHTQPQLRCEARVRAILRHARQIDGLKCLYSPISETVAETVINILPYFLYIGYGSYIEVSIRTKHINKIMRLLPHLYLFL